MIGPENERKSAREERGLTQHDAASLAGVSEPTWRRWEANPDSVGATSRASCERVLAYCPDPFTLPDPAAFNELWKDDCRLTPRQAYAIVAALDRWAEAIDVWVHHGAFDSTVRTPLHYVAPFNMMDFRAMVYVNDNAAWAECARDQIQAVGEEIGRGVLPFDREGCFFDELLMALALVPGNEVTDLDSWEPESFEGISPRMQAPVEHDERCDEHDNCECPFGLTDDAWDRVSDTFNAASRWGEWEVPVRHARLLPQVLADHHPYTWFDRDPGTGPGSFRDLDLDLAIAMKADARRRLRAGTDPAAKAAPRH